MPRLIPLGLSILLVGCGEGERELPPSATYLIEARHALAGGDSAKAMEALTASIDSDPNTWALLERAKLHLTNGNEDAASADCLSALEIDPANRDIKWLQREIKKPASQRFKGRNKLPPSYTK
ncbi:hypothetical protein OAS39_04110 [Pirellulales bacterium]|nr:hypothetical protein [Pirellulales bacterium]